MFICEDCGSTREEEELNTVYVDSGVKFQDGNNGWDELDTDCSCGGVYVEAEKCEHCGEWAAFLHNGVCDDCLEGEATVHNAISFGNSNQEDISVNGYFAKLFGEAQINSILRNKYLELTTEAERKAKATEFCLNDKDEFAEFIKEWL